MSISLKPKSQGKEMQHTQVTELQNLYALYFREINDKNHFFKSFIMKSFLGGLF